MIIRCGMWGLIWNTGDNTRPEMVSVRLMLEIALILRKLSYTESRHWCTSRSSGVVSSILRHMHDEQTRTV